MKAVGSRERSITRSTSGRYMIRLVPKKVLTYRDGSWWFRVGDTARQTILSSEEHYEDACLEVSVHKSEKKALVGHQVRVKLQPPVPMLCCDYVAAVIYTRDFYSEIRTIFANHFFRVLAVGTVEKNYLIVVRNGKVHVPNNSQVRSVESMLGAYDND